MYSCRQCTGYDECRSFFGRRGGSNICKNFNLVKENDDLVKGTDDLVNDLVKEIRRQTLIEFREKINDYLMDRHEYEDFIVTDDAIDCVIEQMKDVHEKICPMCYDCPDNCPLEQMKEVRNENIQGN